MSHDFDIIPLILTVPEFADLLRIGRGAAYDLVRCGQVRSIKIGHSIRITRKAVLDYLGLTA